MKKKTDYAKKKNKDHHSGKGMGISARLLALTLLFALVANIYMAHENLFTGKSAYILTQASSKKTGGQDQGEEKARTGQEDKGEEMALPGQEDKGEGATKNPGRILAASVSDRFGITYPVDSEKTAEQALKDVGSDIGLDMARYGYTCISHDHHHLMDTYTLNQTYRGVPVLGQVLTMTVEPEGAIRTIIGGQAQVPDSADSLLSSAIGEDKAKKLWDRYTEKRYGAAGQKAKKTVRGLHIICQEGEDPRLVYLFRMDRKEKVQSTIFHVDAISGKVESFGNMTEAAMKHFTLPGQTGDRTLALDQVDTNQVLLQDTNRHIGIYAYGKDEEAIAVNPARRADGRDPVKQSGVDALYNIQRAWQYFARTYGRKGLKDDDSLFRIYVGLPEGSFDDNGLLIRNPAGDQYILIGQKKNNPHQVSAWLDLMGHEYTHGMIGEAWDKEFGIAYPVESEVISEGLADLFGELIEDSYDGTGKASYFDNSCDWVSMKYTSSPRSAKEARGDQVTSYQDIGSLSDAHDGAYLISHCAWLMTQGVDGTEEKKINNLRLGQLFYNAFWSVNGLSSLEDFRFALENTAASLCRTGRLTVPQVDCVIDALDQTGIPASYDACLHTESDLTIYDQDHALLQDGLITIADLSQQDKKMAEKEAFSGKYHWKSDPGLYALQVTDQDENLICRQTLLVNDDGQLQGQEDAGPEKKETNEKETNEEETNEEGLEEKGMNEEEVDEKGMEEKQAYRKSLSVSTRFLAGEAGRDITVIPTVTGSLSAGQKKDLLSYVDSLLTQVPSTRIRIIGKGKAQGSDDETGNTVSAESDWTVLNQSFTPASVKQAILSLGSAADQGREDIPEPKGSDLAGALACAHEALFSQSAGKEPGYLVLLCDEGNKEKLTEAKTLSDSLKNRGLVLIGIDISRGADDGESTAAESLKKMASADSFYPASGGKHLHKILNHLSYRQTHPGRMSRIEIAGQAQVRILQNGKEVLSWQPAHSEAAAAEARTDMKESGKDQANQTSPQDEKHQTGEKYGMSLTDYGLVWREKGRQDRLIFELQAGSGSPYEIALRGLGKESLNLKLSCQDQDGNYSDRRTVKDIAMTEKSQVFTSLNPAEPSYLLIDQDGKGQVDRIEKVVGNGKGQVTSGRIGENVQRLFFLFLVLCILALILPALIRRLIAKSKERKEGPVCLQCGMRNKRGARACRRCGKLLPAPQEGHESKFSRGQEKKGSPLPRILFALALLILTFVHVQFSCGPGALAYREFTENHQTAGAYFYKGLGRQNGKKATCDFLLKRYIRRLDKDKVVDKKQVKILKENYKRISR